MKAIIYKARRGLFKRTQYRARIMSKGRVTLVTPESYNNPDDIEDMLRELSPTLPIVR